MYKNLSIADKTTSEILLHASKLRIDVGLIEDHNWHKLPVYIHASLTSIYQYIYIYKIFGIKICRNQSHSIRSSKTKYVCIISLLVT